MESDTHKRSDLHQKKLKAATKLHSIMHAGPCPENDMKDFMLVQTCWIRIISLIFIAATNVCSTT